MTENVDAMVVTDCCGQLLPASQTLLNDVHYPELCPACQWLDGREHDRHRTCNDALRECPGPNWTYIRGHIIKEGEE